MDFRLKALLTVQLMIGWVVLMYVTMSQGFHPIVAIPAVMLEVMLLIGQFVWIWYGEFD